MRKIVKRGLALGLSVMLSVAGSVPGTNSIVYLSVNAKAEIVEPSQKTIAGGIDILEYESNTSATEFVVNDIAGFEKIAELVNSGKETFTGKTITLNADLEYDKSKENNYDVIGGSNQSGHQFGGVFDGAFHTISGINLNSELPYVGLFGKTGANANILKIILEDSSIVSQDPSKSKGDVLACGGIVGSLSSGACINECIIGENVEIAGENLAYVGGIAGYVGVGASISKCINISAVNFSAVKEIENYYYYSKLGGIAGFCAGEIRRCINYGRVCGVCSVNSCYIEVGGICGESVDNIVECCNMGEVLMEGKLYHRGNDIGGVTGKDGKILNCYNGGAVIGIDGMCVGGIAGTYFYSKSTMQNSYSVGNVTNGYAGAITSVPDNSTLKLSNCYWLTGTAANGVCETGREEGENEPQDISSVFEYNRTQMTSQDFVDELNANSQNMGYDEVWAADTENINNGYPILKNVPYTIDDLTGPVNNDFDYKIIDQSTIEITKYKGSDTEVKIPAQIDGKPVSSIGMSAFHGCTGITKVSCPDSVVKIGGYAFQNCSKLKEINIPSAVTEIGKYAFENCNELKQVTIPAGVPKIEEHTFMRCSSLAEVVFLNNPESIDGWAFWGCTSLTGIRIPDSVKSIGKFAFEECTNLKEITLPSELVNMEKGAFETCTSLTEINIPEGVASIAKGLFRECTSLESVYIPVSVTDIKNSAFDQCGSLKDVYYSGIKTQWDQIAIDTDGNDKLMSANVHYKENIEEKQDYIYRELSDGTIEILKYTGSDSEVIIPDEIDGKRVTKIGNGAFYSLRTLTKITLPNSVVSIGEDVFDGCDGLTDIRLSENLTAIGNNAFSGCAGLTKISIPDRCTYIGNAAFRECSGLAEISIPASIVTIGESAFQYCSGLTDVYYSGIRSQWDEIDINNERNANAALLNAVIHFSDGIVLNGPLEEEPQEPEILSTRQELERLKSGDPFLLNQDFQHYLSDEQIDIMESYLYTWLAEINYTYQYSGISGVRERIMKKAGINPQGDFASGMEQAVTHICVETKYGSKTFEITLDLGLPDHNGNLYPTYSAMHYEILEKESIPSDLPTSGQIGRESYADLGAFAECVRKASEDSLHGTYQWELLDEEMTAGVLVDKTVTEIIGNKNGSFSDAVFIIYVKPLLTYSKKVTIACPVDVHVYSMDGTEAGSIVGNKPEGGNANVRLDVNGDTKTVYLAGNDYYLNLHGTDTGTMRYEVEEIANEEVRRNVQFLELQLKKDMQYEGYVFRPLNIDRDLYALRTVGGSEQKVFYADKDTYQVLFRRIQSLSLSQGQTSLNRDKTVQLQASLFPLNASNPNLQWTTDNDSIIKVDNNGLVTAVGAGHATVTVSTKDGSFLKQFCVIDVAEKINHPNSNPGGGSSGSSSGWSGGESVPPVEQEKTPVVANLHYVLQFNTNGGTGLSRRTMTLLADDSPGIMPKVKRKDYVFNGWYTQQDGGTQVTGDKPLKEAATLYAQWTKAEAPAKAAAPALQSKKKGQIRVSLQKVTGAAGYQIEYAASKTFTSSKVREAGAAAKSRTLSGLKAGKKYYVRLRAYSVDSMKNRIYGAYSAVKSVKVKN